MITTNKQKYLGLPEGTYSIGTTLVSSVPVNFRGTDFLSVEVDLPLEHIIPEIIIKIY